MGVENGKAKRVQGKGAAPKSESSNRGAQVDRKRGLGPLPMPALPRVAPGKFEAPAQDSGPDRSAPRPAVVTGGSYLLRNGARVKVITCREIAAKIDGKPGRYRFFVGHFDGTKQKCTWGLDGRYSPVSDGPLDIVARAR